MEKRLVLKEQCPSNGFTLIELLVVIAIIGGLTALFVPNFMGARERARDSQRKSDLKQIQKALEMYRQDNLLFPTGLPTPGATWNSTSGVTYMNKVPGDPLGVSSYYFSVDNNNLTYTLCSCLENVADVDFSSCVVCTGLNCASSKCYVVKQP